MHSANDLDVPDPALWFKYTTDILAATLLLSSIFTLILYYSEKFSKKVRQRWTQRRSSLEPEPLLAEDLEQAERPEKIEQVMGSITFCYCCSNFILAFLWFQIFDSSVSEEYGDIMAFMTLFCLFNCSFYQMSFKYYFWCYFQHKKAIQEIGETNERNPSIDFSDPDDGRQVDQFDSTCLEQDLKKFVDILEDRCEKLEDNIVQHRQQKMTNYRDLIRLEKLIKESTMNSMSPVLISMNSKLNALVNIGAFSLTALPTLAGNLGCGYLGDWSVQYKPEIQTDGVIFYLLIITGDIILSTLILMELNGKRGKYKERLQALKRRENLTVAEKQERYYLNNIRWFIVAMTFLNLAFLAVNIYASRATENVPHRWTYTSWKCLALVHFASPAIQSFFLFVLKYFEPIPRGV